jgi:hypothetical protein
MGIVIPRFPAFAHPDAESKEIKLIFESIDELRLCLVQGKFQPFKYLSQYRHSLVRFIPPAKYDKSSSARESHPHALTEPYVNLSAHTAPIV